MEGLSIVHEALGLSEKNSSVQKLLPGLGKGEVRKLDHNNNSRFMDFPLLYCVTYLTILH